MINILEFHIKNNYYIKVVPPEAGYGCVATFPNNIFKQIEAKTKYYLIDTNKNLLEVVEHRDNYIDNPKIKEYESPIHAMRLLVAQDLVIQAQKLDMSPKLIIPFDDDGPRITKNNDLFSTLLLDIGDEDKEKEEKLCIEVYNVLTNNSRVSEKIKEDAGFLCILKCIENGGL